MPALDLDEHADPVVGAILVGLAQIALGERVDVCQVGILADLDRATEDRELVVPVVSKHREGDARLSTQLDAIERALKGDPIP